jgi:hypothetical protein
MERLYADEQFPLAILNIVESLFAPTIRIEVG